MKKQPFFECDFASHFSVLSDEQAGKIIKAIFNYQKNLTETNFKNKFLNTYWQLTKQKVQQSTVLFDKRRITSKKNGQKGGRPSNSSKTLNNLNNLNNLNIIKTRLALIDKALKKRAAARTQ